MGLIDLIDKKVYIILKNKYEYNGIIKKVDDDGNGLIFVSMIDKFGKLIMFSSGEIEVLEVKE
jgi:small nuclear ribonucleoprotein (snRNP)-like protein